VKRLDVVCPGFVADCLETLEEIAIEGQAQVPGRRRPAAALHPLPERQLRIHPGAGRPGGAQRAGLAGRSGQLEALFREGRRSAELAMALGARQ